jgi:hypothetical protein
VQPFSAINEWQADPGLVVLLDRPSIQIHIEVKLYEVNDGTAVESKVTMVMFYNST